MKEEEDEIETEQLHGQQAPPDPFEHPATLKEETFASGKTREIFGINFRELAVFAFLARINFREFMI